jgi:pimeloyl-ACP methyl ester carboxylesterase
MRRRLLAVVLAVLTALTLVAVPADAADTPKTCPDGLTVVDPTVDPTTQPVVFVHGLNADASAWAPMTSILKGRTDAKRYTFLTFDYQYLHSSWASHPGIAACLARFIHQVSAAAGGQKVLVVAHSMGGLAIRFASDSDSVDTITGDPLSGPIPPGMLGGVVTIDTPALGSPFGGPVTSGVLSIYLANAGVGQVKDAPNDAILCLAEHGKNSDLAPPCRTAPYLPAGVPLHQISGNIIFNRPMFGTSISAPLGSDGIVGVASQDGYQGSGPGGTQDPGTTVTTFDRQCLTTVGAGGLLGLTGLAAAGLVALVWSAGVAVADAPEVAVGIGVGASAAAFSAISFYGYSTSQCGHNTMLQGQEIAGDVAAALRRWAAHMPAPAPGPAAQSPAESARAASCTAQQMAACDQLWKEPPSTFALRDVASNCGGAAEVGSSGYSGYEGRCAQSFPTPTGPRRVVFGGWGVAVAGASIGAAAVVAGGSAANEATTTGSCLEVGIGTYSQSDPKRSYVILSAATKTILGVHAPPDAVPATGLTAGATEADIRKAYAGDDITWLYGYQGSTWVLLVNAPGAPDAAIGFAFGGGLLYQQDQKPPPGTGYTSVVGGIPSAASGGELCSGPN